MAAPSALRPILTAQTAAPKASKLPSSNLPSLAPKTGLGDPRRISFQPAQKLDPKHLKTVVRRWYRFDKCGRMSIIEAGKTELTESLGVHSRDLRVLDAQRSNSSYPSCILCREKALVINLEFIQVIVTTDTTLVLNVERATAEPLVGEFVQDLQRRLSRASGLAAVDEDGPLHTHGTAEALCKGAGLTDPEAGGADAEKEAAAVAMAANMPGSAREAQEAEIPYELRVLEVCLDHVATTMTERVCELEEESKKRLDALAQRVTPANLDHVRRVKNRMVRLSTRVDTLRSLLERYLSDDADLADLHLSGQRQVEAERAEKQRLREQRRRERQQRYVQRKARYDARQRDGEHTSDSEPSSVSNSTFTISSDDPGWLSSQAEMVIEPYFMSFDNTWSRMQARPRLRVAGPGGRCLSECRWHVLHRPHRGVGCAARPRPAQRGLYCADAARSAVLSASPAPPGFMRLATRAVHGRSTRTDRPGVCRAHASGFQLLVATLCALLRNSVFPGVCGSARAVQAIGEFIDDTEDYVNITLDSHRNQLIQVDLLLTAATFCIGLATLMAGFFGMNLASGSEASATAFTLVAALSSIVAVALLGGFVLVMRARQLAFV